MKRVTTSLTIGVCLLLPLAGRAFATGQPGTSAGVNCGTGSATATPGNSASSPGAPFNEPAPIGTGSGGKAGQVYAGSGANTGTPASPNAVSQYDIACQQVTTQVP
jgi:hypothetical protein